MAKKRTTPEKINKKSQKAIPIDCIPKYSQQPRSSPPKRRTDFSVFLCSPSSLSNPGSSPGSSSSEVRLSNVPATSLLEKKMAVKQFPEDKLVRCSNYQESRPVCSSECFDVPMLEVDSAVPDEGLDLDGNRDISKRKIDIFKVSESTPHASPVSDSNSLGVIPGTVVWARTASQVWWPAEIMEERPTLSDLVSNRHIFVQFYGNHPSAWIDPMTDLSKFEDFFEERSNNPSKDFQEALKLALQRKEQLNSCEKLSPERSAHSGQQDHSSDKWTTSTSSRTIDDTPERGRGKRERKRKVRFDEVTFAPKSEKKVRRLKIMRYLGLVAPVGSPF